MRITIILPEYPLKPNGGYTVAYIFANGLAARGHTVSIVYPYSMKNSPRRFLFLRSLLCRFYKPALTWFALRKDVKIMFVPDLRTEHIPDADIVMATLWTTAEYVATYPREKGIPLHLIQHYETWSGTQERIHEVWRSPMHKIMVARWLIDWGLQLGIPPERMTYLQNSVDASQYHLSVPIAKREAVVSVMYSRFSFKGWAVAQRALRIIRKNCPGVKILIFGSCLRPPLVFSGARYIRNPSLERLVEEIYNKSSIFLCSSYEEGWFLPATEAMACGCALVSTAHQGTREYAEHNKNAVLSPPGDALRLAHNALFLLRNKQERIRIASAGYSQWKGKGWDGNVCRLENVFQKTLALNRSGYA